MNTNTLPNNSISEGGSLFPDIVTRYDEEFFQTDYPFGQDFTLMSPTFFPDYSDIIWIRPCSMLSPYELGDSIHFNLNGELPPDKDILVDSLQIIIHPTEPIRSLSIELYLDNKWVKTISSQWNEIVTFDLKDSNIPEKDRTLSFRKNITVRFKKNGQLHPKTPICCVSPGKPAGIVRGSLKNRTSQLPQRIQNFLTDHNKNVTGLADEQGSLVATWDYDAFGNIIHQTGTATNKNPLRFSSEYHDEDLGLIYYNYRHYNPKDGRWISRDPIGEAGGIHLYSFLNNSSPNSIDYLGLDQITVKYQLPDPASVSVEYRNKGISETTKDHSFSCECICNGKPSITCYISYNPIIYLSKDQAKKYKVSLDDILGHEQRHVSSRILRIKKILAPLDEEDTQIRTVEECTRKAKEYTNQYKNELARDFAKTDHEGDPDATSESPKDATGYPPY